MADAVLEVSLSYDDFPLRFPTERYLTMVRNRYLSLLSLFDDEELAAGIEEIRHRYPGQQVEFRDRFAFVLGRRDRPDRLGGRIGIPRRVNHSVRRPDERQDLREGEPLIGLDLRRSDPSQKAPMITYRATLDGPANWPSTWAGRCTPNAVCAARDWRARSHAEAGEAAVRTPDGARRRRIRIVRDYGMYDRRENPEYYPEVHRR